MTDNIYTFPRRKRFSIEAEIQAHEAIHTMPDGPAKAEAARQWIARNRAPALEVLRQVLGTK